MSDWIERDGKKYFEEGYLVLANNNAKRCGERIAELEAERDRLAAANAAMREALKQYAPCGCGHMARYHIKGGCIAGVATREDGSVVLCGCAVARYSEALAPPDLVAALAPDAGREWRERIEREARMKALEQATDAVRWADYWSPADQCIAMAAIEALKRETK